MEATLYVNTTTKNIRAAIIGNAIPSVPVKLQTHLKLTVYFFATGEEPALLDDATTFRVVLKDKNEPSGSVLALLTAPTATGADCYEFEWASIDSAALRTLLGDSESVPAILETEWTLGTTIERVSMEVAIENAWARTTDGPPDPTEDASWEWLKDRILAGANITLTTNNTAQTLTIVGEAGGGGGAVDWGDIGGTLSAQTDLASALAGKQTLSANLTTFAGIAPAANVQSLLSAADYSAMRTLLGLVIGTNVQAYHANLTTFAGIAPAANVQSLLSAADYSAMRTLLGLVIGTNVQAYHANLTTYAGITPSPDVQSLLSAADDATIVTQLGLSSADDVTFGTVAASATTIGEVNTGVIRLQDSGFLGSLLASLSASRYWAMPDVDGTVITTGNLPDLGGGNWTLLSTTTISGSPATVDVSFTGTHRKFMIELEDVYGTSDGYVLTMRTSLAGDSSFDAGASDYAAALSGIGYYADSRAIAAQCALTNAVHSTANKGVNGQIVFYDPLNSSLKTNWAGTLLCMEYGSAHIKGFDILGRRDTAAAVDAVRFYFSVGNMGGGKIRVFGWSE